MAGEILTVSGYAVLWDAVANIGGEFRERFAKGSLTRSLREGDVRALIGHDRSRVVGRLSAGTLRLTEDSTGLRYEVDADLSTPDGQTIAGTVGRGDVSGVSPGFWVREENWTVNGALPLRTILDASLTEISIVGWPAYEQTSASLSRAANNFAAASRRRAEAAMRLRGIPF
jgi:HK97 family phage prohead protease